MFKNATPRQMALLVGLLTTLGCSAFFIIAKLLSKDISEQWFYFLFPVFIFAISYFITIYILKRYIYRKIKLIYKTIHQQKVSTTEKLNPIEGGSNIIEDVEKEVNKWAASQEAEIEKYKSWAEYRRRFIGDISHELKTPIFNIQGYLHSLLDGGLEDKTVNRKFLKKAVKNVARLHTIVEDLSAISRLEMGELHLEMETFDIKALVLDIIDDLELKAKENNIHLSLKEGADQNFLVTADKESIHQVLMNLILNSIKYGVDNGRTQIGFYDMDKNILIEVADNGIGISTTNLTHVFDRFYRVDKSRSRLKGGAGLGLSIVKHIIEAHKQTINVRSTPTIGSTFGFTLKRSIKNK